MSQAFVANSPKTIGDVLVTQFDPTYTNEQATLAASQAVEIGQVLGQITASGLYVVLAPAASDGSQNAAAIALQKVGSVAATTAIAILEAGPALLNATGVVWPGGITAPQKATATAALKAKGIKIR
jgi:Bacteriophage lambda head decoration protein D